MLSSRVLLSIAGALVSLALGGGSGLAQGPIDGYVKKKGELDLALGLSATGATKFIDGEGEVIPQGFRAQLIGLFGAFGVTDRINVVASVPYVVTDATAGLQDGAVFAKGLFWRKPFRSGDRQIGTLDFIGALGVQVPLSDYEVVANGAIGQRAKVVQPRLLAQWNGTGYFLNALAGYNYRFDALDEVALARIQRTRPGYRPQQPYDNVNILVRAGYPGRRFYVDAWLELQRTLGGGNFTADLEELAQAYDVDYQQAGGTVYYSESDHWGFAASGARVLGGKNTSEFWRLTGTLVYKL